MLTPLPDACAGACFFAFFWRIAGGPYTRHPASDAPSEACADAARAPRPRPTNRLCRAGPDGSTEDAFRPHHLPTLSCMTLSPGLRRPFCTCAEPRARGTIRAARAARLAASAASHRARKARQAARRAKWRFRPCQRGDGSHRPCISISGRKDDGTVCAPYGPSEIRLSGKILTPCHHMSQAFSGPIRPS